ncbi:MAG: PLP-dependent aminotransferase family protein [Kofleriaceae bacterium]|nr:PLP-dependent aminotransferase family protein [Kofleriaceae bacterium]
MDPRIVALQKRACARGVIGLAGGLPATELMPRDDLARALAEAATHHAVALTYDWPEGVEPLRVWIANRLSARGARVDPQQVIVTSGAQQALSLIAMAHRGERIAVGDATYPAAIAAFERAGVEVVAHSADAHYLMPGVSNPRGIDLVEPRRAWWLGREALIADEAYTELRFDGRIERPLVADAPTRVWHVGTLSKTLSPGLRVGWLVPPRSEHQALLDLKEAADLQTASVTQQASSLFLARFDYDAHVARSRLHYRERAARLCEALRRELPYARFAEPEGGFAVWVELDEPGDEIGLLHEAIAAGVTIDPGRAFRPRDAASTISFRASFSSAAIDELAEGAHRLALTVERWLTRGARAMRRRS